MLHAYRFATQQGVADDVNGGLSRIELFHARCKIIFVEQRLPAIRNQHNVAITWREVWKPGE
jgi:hypothetical protein